MRRAIDRLDLDEPVRLAAHRLDRIPYDLPDPGPNGVGLLVDAGARCIVRCLGTVPSKPNRLGDRGDALVACTLSPEGCEGGVDAGDLTLEARPRFVDLAQRFLRILVQRAELPDDRLALGLELGRLRRLVPELLVQAGDLASGAPRQVERDEPRQDRVLGVVVGDAVRAAFLNAAREI